jgi:hypothetical protein
MKEHFKQQYEHANPITQELLDEMPQKTYSSGEERQVDDIPLWGLKAVFELNNNDEELILNLFSLCDREFPYYSELYSIISSPFNTSFTIPIFVEKGSEEKCRVLLSKHIE